MELRNLAILMGLCLLAVSSCTEARHSMHRRETDNDIFAADEAMDDDGTQNDEFEGERDEEPPAIQGVIVTRPKIYEIQPGTDVRLECNVEPDNATVVVQWYKGSELYFMNTMKTYFESDIQRYSIDPNSKDLLIENVESSDAGVYRCELAQDKPVSIEHTIVVLESPKIVRFLATNDGNVLEGSDLLLTCDVIGKPPPEIVWSRSGDNGNRRLVEKDGDFSQNSVFMKNVKREHSGKYYCYAFNSVGTTQAELQVYVAGKPHVHVRNNIINSAINVEALLECSSHYESNPHIRWYKDGKLIEDSSTQYIISTRGSHSNLTVTPATDEDFGTFTCEAENNIGKHNRSISLVQRPVVTNAGGESGRLLWTVHSHHALQEIRAQVHGLGEAQSDEWKQFDIPLPKTQGHKYELVYDLNDKLEPGKYEAIIKVKNDYSWSDNIDPIVFEIDVEPQYIQHASVYRGASSKQSSSLIMAPLMYLLVRFM